MMAAGIIERIHVYQRDLPVVGGAYRMSRTSGYNDRRNRHCATIRPALLAGVWVVTHYVGERYAPNGPVLGGPNLPVPTPPGLGISPAPGIFGEPVATYA